MSGKQSNAPSKGPAASRVEMLDLAPYPLEQRVRQAVLGDGAARVTWDDGRVSRLHALWLRDNCACSACRHEGTLERRYLFLDGAGPELSSVEAREGHLRVRFADGHESRFDAGWLRARAYDDWARAERRQEPPLWRNELAIPRVSYAAVMAGEEGVAAWLTALLESGIAILEGMPPEPGRLLEILRQVQEPRATNFGTTFEVFTHPKPNSSAYTAMALELHADLVNWAFPPDFQALFCIRNEASGGGSLFANAYSLAEALKEEAPFAFDLLSRIPVEFRFQDEDCDIRHRAPVIELDAQGHVRRLRFNNWLRSHPVCSAAEMEDWYEAYATLWRLLRDPAFQLRLKLRPGEMVVFDNVRVLHGREAFDPASGARHLEGGYLDRDWVLSRLRLAERRLAG